MVEKEERRMQWDRFWSRNLSRFDERSARGNHAVRGRWETGGRAGAVNARAPWMQRPYLFKCIYDFNSIFHIVLDLDCSWSYVIIKMYVPAMEMNRGLSPRTDVRTLTFSFFWFGIPLHECTMHGMYKF